MSTLADTVSQSGSTSFPHQQQSRSEQSPTSPLILALGVIGILIILDGVRHAVVSFYIPFMIKNFEVLFNIIFHLDFFYEVPV